jgi:hypothetical protein
LTLSRNGSLEDRWVTAMPTITTTTRRCRLVTVPKLARVDVVRGEVTGVTADRDTFTAPKTKVVRRSTSSATPIPGRTCGSTPIRSGSCHGDPVRQRAGG